MNKNMSLEFSSCKIFFVQKSFIYWEAAATELKIFVDEYIQ